MDSGMQLETLINKYQNLIFSICFRLTGDYFEAEDLAQDTFLSAYKNLHTFDGANERAWLCRIATNKCIDYLKRAGRRSVPTEDEFFSSITDSRSSPEDLALENAVKQKLFRLCDSLKPPYREVALAYFYYELDVGEIAGRSGKNIKTVQTQIYRAKAMLKNLYQKEDFHDG